jgi:GH24 family phage-related lysozyme (muramidase)
MNRKALFDAVRPFAPSGRFTENDVGVLNGLADRWGMARETPAAPASSELSNGLITERVAKELIGHEAIVREAYKDSEGVWTWGVGVTSRSGHAVERYKDHPQTIQRCLEVYLWLCRTKYGPEVMAAFRGHALTEAQFAAALLFHNNPGELATADWVESWKAGRVGAARSEFMNWRTPASIIERREKERDLFFDGRWTGEGKATVYEVAKPSYSPRWSSARKVDVSGDVRAALKAAGQ